MRPLDLPQIQAPITESQTISDIKKQLSFDSALLLDLDNTIMQAAVELGSDQWFSALCVHAESVLPDKKFASTMVLELYFAIQHIVRQKKIEDNTALLIARIQDLGIPVLAITARDHGIKDATIRQLKDIGIDFSRIPAHYGYNTTRELNIARKSEEQPFYEGGIIFCCGNDKGACLKAFLDTTSWRPKHVVMVDDKQKHLEHVQSSVESFGVRFNGFRYGTLDEKAKNIDMHQAHRQLAAVKCYLPESVQDHAAKLKIEHPFALSAQVSLKESFYIEEVEDAASASDVHARKHSSSQDDAVDEQMSPLKKSKMDLGQRQYLMFPPGEKPRCKSAPPLNEVATFKPI